MATEVRVPTTGNAGEDAVLLDWLVVEGQEVSAGDVLVTLETAKSTIDIEAPASGRVLKIHANAGAEVAEYSVIAVIGAPDEVAPTVPTEVEAVKAVDRGRAGASPRARILAARHAIDLNALHGTGPGGRILAADVLAADRTALAPPPAPAQAPARALADSGQEDQVVVPVRGARKVTAERMLASLQQTAQLTLTRYAPAGALLRYAARLREVTDQRALPRIGVNDLLLFAAARAMARHPEANSWFDWDGITQFRRVNLGFAVDTGQALLVPVIPRADVLPLADLAAAAHTAIDRCRSGSLTPDEMTGGTFTVSNLGGLGVHWFTPVLNPPQSCVLGVGAVHTPHPEATPLLPLSLTFDHRALDGGPAAALLADIASCIETVDVLSAL